MTPKAVTVPTAAVLPQPTGLDQLTTNVNALFPQIGTAATFQVGAGAGNGSNGSASVTTTNASSGGIITVTTGAANNSTSSIVGALNSGVTFAALPAVTISPANINAAALNNSQGVYAVPTLMGFNLNNGSVALATTTTYQWNYRISG